jgi:Lar family restriction alleviation protein
MNDYFVRDCPFCGKYTPVKNPTPNTSGSFHIPFVNSGGTRFYCNTCHAEGPNAINEKEAVEKWNDRILSDDGSCPFCGSNDLGIKSRRDNSTYSIVCNKCSANGPEAEKIDDAKKKWEQAIQ